MILPLIFSCNRPWQCSELLRSLYMFTDCPQPTVLFRSDKPQWTEQYLKMSEHFPCTLVEERIFSEDLRDILKLVKEHYIMFMVDDLLFYDGFSFESAVKCLEDYSLYTYQVKMCKDYTTCFSGFVRISQRVPPFKELGGRGLEFAFHRGTVDWDYPFDLSCSLYRISDVLKLIDVVGYPRITDPNKFEGLIADVLKKIQHTYRAACPVSRVCNVVSLNHSLPGKPSVCCSESEASLEEMNKNFDADVHFDYEFFRNLNPTSVHVTEYKLCTAQS